ncbi:MAG: hypothetical protein HN435_17040 [Nitrospinaceae bacterium]|nr:hypothetical protein [Nitrospinaceae bacterium]
MVLPHTEKIRPPRALWVPFDFGRPFGAPNEPEFQMKVLRAALALFEAEQGPVLEKFPDDAPGPKAGLESWVCPVPMSRPAEDADSTGYLDGLLEEMANLRTWYDLGKEKRGRTTVGVSGMEVEVAARFIVSFLSDSPMENPRADLSAPDVFKLALEDLRAYYFESAVSQPGNPGAREVAEWFWDETSAGNVFMALEPVLAASEDKIFRLLAERMLVPRAQFHKMPEESHERYMASLGSRLSPSLDPKHR